MFNSPHLILCVLRAFVVNIRSCPFSILFICVIERSGRIKNFQWLEVSGSLPAL